jgi:hypothetical protein
VPARSCFLVAVVTQSKYCCPECGHPILPKDPLAILSLQQRRIFDAIHSAGQAGIDSQALRERVYNSTTGGVSSQLIGTHIHNINRKIRLLRMTISSKKAGRYGACYVVEALQLNHGEDNTKAKFTDEEIRRIRRDMRPTTRLARVYGVNYRTIDRIRKLETWKHVT